MLYGSSNIVYILIYNDGFVGHPQRSLEYPLRCDRHAAPPEGISDAPAVTEHSGTLNGSGCQEHWGVSLATIEESIAWLSGTVLQCMLRHDHLGSRLRGRASLRAPRLTMRVMRFVGCYDA
jgi:hypothetical protein